MSSDMEIIDGDDDGDDDDFFYVEQAETDEVADDPPDSSTPNTPAVGNLPVAQAEIALQDYKNLGSTRSITALHNLYLARKLKDPNAPIPTDSLYTLGSWESMYGWKELAWEHDAETNRAFAAKRRDMMAKMYGVQNTRADMLMRVAEKTILKIEEDIDKGVVALSPQDALKFLESGQKSGKEAQEAILKLEDPHADDDNSGTDFFDSIRKLGLLQINQINHNYGNTP